MAHRPRMYRLPKRSARALGAQGKIFAVADDIDPSFQIDGEPNPFTVYFPISITNLYSATIYVTSLMISPPVGWTDSEQNVTTLAIGQSKRVEKSNATRATGCQGTNETVTVRWNYRTGSYAGPIIGFDDFTFGIYWETIASGTVDEFADFESDPVQIDSQWYIDNWLLEKNAGANVNTRWGRNTSYYVHGASSLQLACGDTDDWIQISKSVGVGAGSRAGIYGYIWNWTAGMGYLTVTTPVETQTLILAVASVWRRFGARLNVGSSNQVVITWRSPWSTAGYLVIDWIRTVHW